MRALWLMLGLVGCGGAATTAPAGTTPETTSPTGPTTSTPTTEPTTPATTPAAVCPDTAPSPAVATTAGCVTGATLPSGREAFLGIPYAEPPVGDHRFARPVPAAPWSEPRAATALGPICVQFDDDITGEHVLGDGAEDCLNLNVFRPAGAANLPVLFFSHGGGHITGSGGEPYYTEDPALSEQAVVVTYNYRLGPLGWLAHPALSAADPDGASGNLGLRDTLLALDWVRANAAAFGGDPARITVFGESAGGLTTCALLASPAAAGAFSAAIIESAPCGGISQPLRGDPESDGETEGLAFAAAMGCDGADPVACLRAAPLADVIAAGASSSVVFDTDVPHWRILTDGVLLPAAPVAETLASGAWNQVPVLATLNRDEGTIFTVGYAPDEAALDVWLLTFAVAYGIDYSGLKALYDPGNYGGSTEDALAAAYGDLLFVCPTVWQQRALAAQAPAYGGWFVHPTLPLDLFGAFHGSELPFVFGTGLTELTAQERDLSARMQGAWRGMPAPALTDLGPWPTVDAGWVSLDVTPSAVVAEPRAEVCAWLEGQGVNPYQ